jgi:hypothetical protein
MSCIAKRLLPWLAAAFAFSSCGNESGKQGAASGPPTPVQLARRAAAGMGQVVGHWGSFHPAPGLFAADYEAFGPAADDPAPIAANGAFSTTVFAGRAGIVFAAPRSGTATRGALPAECGLYMSPALGNGQKIAYGAGPSGQPAWVVSAQGYMALDATTTVVSLVLLDPALASPDPAIQQAQATWLVGKLAAGWPATATAAAAYDAALGARRDPAIDPAFVAALAQAMAQTLAEMPTPAPQPVALARASRSEVERRFAGLQLAGAFVHFDADPNAKVAVRVASAGKVVSYVTPEPLDAKRADVSVAANRGTAVDLYYTIRRIDIAALPRDSNALSAPTLTDRLPLQGDVIKAGVIPASSWWGYLDVLGNLVSWATDQAMAAAGVAYATIAGASGGMAEAGQALEIRVFSGGFANGQQPEIAAHVQAYYGREAAIAYRQNVAMAVVELLLMIPGADVVLGDEFGAKVVAAAVTQAFRDLETHAATAGTTSEGLGSSMLQICGNAAKSALDAAIQEAANTKRQLRGGWKKLFSFVGAGGRRLLKTVGRTLTGGWVAKGGQVANRLERMAMPYSLMEYHVAAIGGGACRELLESVAKKAGSDPGLRFRTICEDCLEAACQAECAAALAADMTGLDACHEACSASVNPCVEKVRADTTACNQRCGQTRTAACGTDPDCLFRIPGECMKECKPFDALAGGPCYATMNQCFAACAQTHASAKAAEEGFYGCVQRACMDRCEPAEKE